MKNLILMLLLLGSSTASFSQTFRGRGIDKKPIEQRPGQMRAALSVPLTKEIIVITVLKDSVAIGPYKYKLREKLKSETSGRGTQTTIVAEGIDIIVYKKVDPKGLGNDIIRIAYNTPPKPGWIPMVREGLYLMQ